MISVPSQIIMSSAYAAIVISWLLAFCDTVSLLNKCIYFKQMTTFSGNRLAFDVVVKYSYIHFHYTVVPVLTWYFRTVTVFYPGGVGFSRLRQVRRKLDASMSRHFIHWIASRHSEKRYRSYVYDLQARRNAQCTWAIYFFESSAVTAWARVIRLTFRLYVAGTFMYSYTRMHVHKCRKDSWWKRTIERRVKHVYTPRVHVIYRATFVRYPVFDQRRKNNGYSTPSL